MGRPFLLVFVALFLSCSVKQPAETIDFTSFKDRFLLDLWKHNPGWASHVGFHDYDSLLPAPDENHRKAELAFCRSYLDSLKMIDRSGLDRSELTDLLMIKDRLEATIWYNEVLKGHEWNPASYNVGGVFGLMINGRYAPLEQRLRMMSAKMEKLEAYYAAAKNTIRNPTREHTELAILQNEGALSVFGPALIDSVHASSLEHAEKENLLANIELAKMAISDYVDFLRNSILPQLVSGARDFRIGKQLYEQKFGHDIVSSFTADQIFDKAVQAKQQLHADMFEVTKKIWGKHLGNEPMPADSLKAIRILIDRLSLQHCHRDSFLWTIEQQLPQLTAFVSQKGLLDLDPDKPLIVRKEPAYMTGVAGASISAPGPYDSSGDTYYNVRTLDHYTEEQAESYLREYNDYILQILNIHEAVPGHYAQLVYSNHSPSVIKSVFGNGAMIEGWAVYAERMMLEQGYGNNSPEMWLMYYKWNLRTICNTILDYSVHVQNMSREQAMDLLVRQAFQQEAEAEGKWRRATLTQVQLCSYFTGFYEIMELREEMRKKLGERFDLREFHEEFLSYGSAPIKYVRELMLNTAEQSLAMEKK